MSSTPQRRLTSPAASSLVAISQAISAITGVQLGERQRVMVQSRLHKRMAELGHATLEEYLPYFESHRKEETDRLISLLTTHHTFFFREYVHFEYLLDHAIPKIIPIVRARPGKRLRVWSAACSRGQEVYSLAMFLKFHLQRLAPDLSFEVLGTDVDPDSIAVAKNGVFHREEIKEAPLALLADHWSRGTGEIAAYVKAKRSLKNHVRFETSNLLDLPPDGSAQFDVIFCRNVFIYFSADQVRLISKELLKKLTPSGYFITGVSENLGSLGLEIDNLGPSIYSHKKPKTEKSNLVPALDRITATPPELRKLLRVICVDDSPSIHSLLKQIFKKEEGFEIVGTAMNGIEAAKLLKTVEADVVTLDIHMPELDGIGYLERHFKKDHPPVVMLTSVSRENAELALKALKLGAADYVEKPALSNLLERGEELRTKLRCAYRSKLSIAKVDLAIELAFKSVPRLVSPESKLRVVVFSLPDRQKLKALLRQWLGIQPPVALLLEGAQETFPELAKALGSDFGMTITAPQTILAPLRPGEIVLLDVKQGLSALKAAYSATSPSIMVLGEASRHASEKILQWTGAQLILEDLGRGEGAKNLTRASTEIVPITSFSHHSNEFLCKVK